MTLLEYLQEKLLMFYTTLLCVLRQLCLNNNDKNNLTFMLAPSGYIYTYSSMCIFMSVVKVKALRQDESCVIQGILLAPSL